MILQRKYYLLLLLPVFLVSCGKRTSGALSGEKRGKPPREHKIVHPLLNENGKVIQEDTAVVQIASRNTDLYAFLEEWEGTPHRMGGMSKKGVDCSGLVCILYEEVYAQHFDGRSAADIFREVKEIERTDLREGDLLFFKISGSRINHVGVYLKDGEFLHTSSSRGVMISHLDEAYWRKRYFAAGRVR